MGKLGLGFFGSGFMRSRVYLGFTGFSGFGG